MTDIPRWTITTDDDLSACSKQLWDDHHIPSDERRGWDEHNVDFHTLDVHSPNPDAGGIVTVIVGSQLRLIDGEPRAMSAAELAAWGVN